MMISNFGTGVLEKLGLGAEAMHSVNPDLIIAMISAFGQTGPLRHYMGYGPLISPLAGLSAVTGYEDGVPQDIGMPYGDPNGGVYTAFAIAAALCARQRHGGGGQVIDLSMWEAMLCTSFEALDEPRPGQPAILSHGQSRPCVGAAQRLPLPGRRRLGGHCCHA